MGAKVEMRKMKIKGKERRGPNWLVGKEGKEKREKNKKGVCGRKREQVMRGGGLSFLPKKLVKRKCYECLGGW